MSNQVAILNATKFIVLVESPFGPAISSRLGVSVNQGSSNNLHRLEVWAQDECHCRNLVQHFYFKGVFPKEIVSIERTAEKKPMPQWNEIERLGASPEQQRTLDRLKQMRDELE